MSDKCGAAINSKAFTKKEQLLCTLAYTTFFPTHKRYLYTFFPCYTHFWRYWLSLVRENGIMMYQESWGQSGSWCEKGTDHHLSFLVLYKSSSDFGQPRSLCSWQVMHSHFVVLLLAVFICMCSVSGVPLQIDPRDDKSYVPEQYPLKVNGPLPEGVSVIQGYCENCTMYPEENSVSAFSSSSTQDYRIASEAEIKAHTFYTALSANAYCRTVIPGGRWSCPHCGVASNLQITKTFSTLITDTNVLVAVGEKEKTIYVVFRGTSSIRNAIAVSSPLTNMTLCCSSDSFFLTGHCFCTSELSTC